VFLTEKQMTYPIRVVEDKIITVRGYKVILDVDLSGIYGVSTKRLNEQVKRNLDRFPQDFMFRLSRAEVNDLNRSQFATGSQKHRDPRFPPFVFTEHGAIMAANVLNSRQAVQMGVFVVRAFVRLREVLAVHKDLAHKLDALEKIVGVHDEQFKTVLNAIRVLMKEPEKPKRRIGFTAEEKSVKHSAGG